jgi:asparagine synthase (glutamine-hydrolysing)
MCGICGWISFHKEDEPKECIIKNMNAFLTHRGPDQAGVKLFPDMAMAISRLSIIDLNTGEQPIANEDQTCWIVFNGEIYNFMDLRASLEKRGHTFSTQTDTEVIIHAYEEWGPECVQRLRGMFAFAIYDSRNSEKSGQPSFPGPQVFMARDPLGKKPLYYYFDSRRLIFASEIKAILAHPKVPRRVDRQVIPLYLTFGYVPAPDTIFEGIKELPPGHTLQVKQGTMKVDEYWDILGSHSFPALSIQKNVTDLRELLTEAVRLRLVSDVPLGAFLSGGLDSTTIVAIITKVLKLPMKTFAIGFDGETSFDESKYAHLAAQALGTEHHEFRVKAEAMDLVPRLVWHYDQPFADSSAIPTFLLSKLTRDHVTVALSGDGGDEIYAGYERFVASKMAEAYKYVPSFIHNSLQRILKKFPEQTSYYDFVRRTRRFISHAPLPLSERYFSWASILNQELIEHIYKPQIYINTKSHFFHYFEKVKDLDSLSQLLYVHLKTCLPGDLLVKIDRMSMANSLEVRCPFLDKNLVEAGMQLPSELKLHGLTTKYILKKAVTGLVPSEIIHRKKHGFSIPLGRWFRSDLRDSITDLLLSSRALSRGYFKEESLKELIALHQNGKKDFGNQLFALMTLELWHRIFLEGEINLIPWDLPCMVSS